MTAAPGDSSDIGYGAEVRRKLLHLVALIIPSGYYWAGRWPSVVVVFFFFCSSLFDDLARLRRWPIRSLWCPWVDPIVRPKESTGFTGATHILLSGWLCPLLFVMPAAAIGMVAIILGDIAAALVGRRWGKHPLGNNRTLEGSLAFLMAAGLGGLLVPGVPVALALGAALLATAVEALSTRIDDNLTVPLAVGLAVHLALVL